MKFNKQTVPLSLAFGMLIAPVQAIHAQNDGSVEATVSGEPAICMTRAKTLPSNSRSDANRKPAQIVVPEMAVSGLTRKGFQQVDCNQAKLNSRASREAWRDKICRKAAFGNLAIQNQYAQIYGERPAALCAAAQRVAGKVDRKKLKQAKPKKSTEK